MPIKEIASKSNLKVKNAKKLQQKKYREQNDLFAVENATIVFDAFKAGHNPDQLFVNKKFVQAHKKQFSALSKSDCRIYLISDEVAEYLTELEAAPGVFAIYKRLKAPIDFNKPLVYLNDLRDPGNLGTILRACLAFGYYNIILDETCADLFNAKTVSAAKNAIFELNFGFDKNLKLLKQIKETKSIVATSLKGEAGIKLAAIQYCLVFGNETRGVDEKILKLADHLIKIPINPKIESLNVALAAAIILHANSKI
jgi:RNA methyltransferase, TrmH family